MPSCNQGGGLTAAPHRTTEPGAPLQAPSCRPWRHLPRPPRAAQPGGSCIARRGVRRNRRMRCCLWQAAGSAGGLPAGRPATLGSAQARSAGLCWQRAPSARVPPAGCIRDTWVLVSSCQRAAGLPSVESVRNAASARARARRRPPTPLHPTRSFRAQRQRNPRSCLSAPPRILPVPFGSRSVSGIGGPALRESPPEGVCVCACVCVRCGVVGMGAGPQAWLTEE